MCKITSQVKFCTCKATSTEKLHNYWALYRRNKDKNIMIIGEVMLTYKLLNSNYELDYALLETRLNEADAFDVPLQSKAHDVLKIVLKNNEYYKRQEFTFTYYKSKWIRKEADDFYLMGHYDEVQFGKLRNK